MEKKYTDIGNRLKILRDKKTQTEMATDLGMTLRTYQFYESGERRPNPETLKTISNKYNKSIEWILSGKEGYAQSLAEPPRVPIAEIPPVYEQRQNGIDPYLQAIADVKEIFDSEDPILIPAIQANLHAFKRAVKREQQFSQILKENEYLRSRMSSLEANLKSISSQFENLQAERKVLKTENNRLKSTYENPDGDDGNITNTSSNGTETL